MKQISIGEDNFQFLIKSESYYIDKTLFIKGIIENTTRVLLIPRPRRFGKTLNMSTLKYFFSNINSNENRKLFDNLLITKTSVFEKYQGKYPVIFISLKNCKGKNFNEVLFGLRVVISNIYKEFTYILTSNLFNDKEIENFNLIETEKADINLLENSLYFLCQLLSKYYNQKIILLLDEYDTPVHEAYLSNFYNETTDFIRVFLGNALKGNDYLEKAVLTGILRVAKESMFSGLNNVEVYSIFNNGFNNYFGFTQTETNQILLDYNLNEYSEKVKNWYNGYYFGDSEIYNPWSILNFVKNKGIFTEYWLNTSANELVHKLIKDSNQSIKKDVEDLLNYKTVLSVVEDNISFPNLESSRENILTFLIHTGYLKAKFSYQAEIEKYYEIFIPNLEVKLIYIKIIQNWLNDNIDNMELKQMLNALLEGDIDLFSEILNKFVIESLSYFNVNKDSIEKVYQAFLLGMLINLKDKYYIESEKESGYGRFDIMIMPKDINKQAIIMELKKIRVKENSKTALQSALNQIEERKYDTVLKQKGYTKIMKLAVTFDGKKVFTKKR